MVGLLQADGAEEFPKDRGSLESFLCGCSFPGFHGHSTFEIEWQEIPLPRVWIPIYFCILVTGKVDGTGWTKSGSSAYSISTLKYKSVSSRHFSSLPSSKRCLSPRFLPLLWLFSPLTIVNRRPSFHSFVHHEDYQCCFRVNSGCWLCCC